MTGWQPAAEARCPAGTDEEVVVPRSGRLHPIQVHRGLKPPEAVLGSLSDLDDETVSIVVSGTDEPLRASVFDPDRLRAVLEGDDVTRTDKGALVLYSRSYGILAVATGPRVAPAQVHCLWGVVRIDNGEAVEVPAADDSQPDWQLLALR